MRMNNGRPYPAPHPPTHVHGAVASQRPLRYDGSDEVAERRVAHIYRQPGTYQVKVWFELPSRVAPQLHRQTVEVHAAK